MKCNTPVGKSWFIYPRTYSLLHQKQIGIMNMRKSIAGQSQIRCLLTISSFDVSEP